MKQLLVPLFSMLFSVSLFAQVSIGIQGGYNLPQLKHDKSPNTIYTYTTSPYKGLQIGVVAEVPLTQSWSFRSGLLINGKGTNLRREGVGGTDDRFIELHYLEVPLLLVYRWKAGKDWFALTGAGGYAARAFRGVEKGEGKSWGGPYYIYNAVEFDSRNPNNDVHPTIVNPFDYGFILTAGVERRNLQLLLSYNHGLQRVFPKSLVFEDKFTSRIFSLSVAYYFGFKL